MNVLCRVGLHYPGPWLDDDYELSEPVTQTSTCRWCPKTWTRTAWPSIKQKRRRDR